MIPLSVFNQVTLAPGLTLLLVAGCYLLGSIPTAVWLSKAFFGQDVRTLGSRNAGSTNMYRVFGFKAGFPVQLIDIGKGVLAASLPQWVGGAEAYTNPESLLVGQLVCGLTAVIGHVYTVFAGFKGGKGVNTILGMMLVVAPWGSLVGVGVFILTLLLGKMVSLGSMLAVSSFSVYLLVRYLLYGPLSKAEQILLGLGILLAVLVVYTHRSNIRRILAGTESKVGFLTRKRERVS